MYIVLKCVIGKMQGTNGTVPGYLSSAACDISDKYTVPPFIYRGVG